MNVIANGGVYVAPKPVGATIDAHGELTETDPSGSQWYLSLEVAQQVNYMMRDVSAPAPQAQQVDGVSAAGKTGTGPKAQDAAGTRTRTATSTTRRSPASSRRRTRR
ncbi:MAG: penicillin-binding transpeptidase domain-containing protein [Ilumatobacteraceae bacterium]